MEFEKDYISVEKQMKKECSSEVEIVMDKPTTLDLNNPIISNDKYKTNQFEMDMSGHNEKNKQPDLSKNQNQKIKGYFGGLKILTLLLEGT